MNENRGTDGNTRHAGGDLNEEENKSTMKWKQVETRDGADKWRRIAEEYKRRLVETSRGNRRVRSNLNE